MVVVADDDEDDKSLSEVPLCCRLPFLFHGVSNVTTNKSLLVTLRPFREEEKDQTEEPRTRNETQLIGTTAGIRRPLTSAIIAR